MGQKCSGSLPVLNLNQERYFCTSYRRLLRSVYSQTIVGLLALGGSNTLPNYINSIKKFFFILGGNNTVKKICEALIKSPTKLQATNKPGTRLFQVPSRLNIWPSWQSCRLGWTSCGRALLLCLQGGDVYSGFSISPLFSDLFNRDIKFAGYPKRHSFESEFWCLPWLF